MSVEEQLQEGIRAHQKGDVARAQNLYQQVLQAEPSNPTALGNLAVIAISSKNYAAAEKYVRAALSGRGNDAGLYSNLGVILRAQGRLVEAVSAYEQALRLRPDYADAYHNLGNTLSEQSRVDEAIAAYRKAIELKPDYSEAFNNLANALRSQGRLDEAVASYRRAIELKPNNPDAHGNLGITLKDQGYVEESIAAHRQAIALRPASPEAYNNIGVALRAQARFEEAATAYRNAIQIKPDYAEAYNNLGNVLQDQGKLDGAISAYARAVELKPDYAESFGQLVHQRQHACDWTSFDADQKRLVQMVRENNSASAIAPFILLASVATPADQLLCARKWAAGVNLKVPPKAKFSHPAPQAKSKLRVGYLSADFHQHATAYLIAELFERHDHKQFEIFGYSYGPDDGSAMRARLVQAFDGFLDIRPLPHGEVARRMHQQGIDILVDLKGYTTHARTEILAYRPAPIQVNYLGYPGTMGADFVDYLIADKFIVPEKAQQFYSETLGYLPDCYQPNDTKREVTDKAPSRAECGLPAQGFVFCSFNNSYKITPTFFDIWMRLLKAVPGSVLWLIEANSLAKTNLRAAAKSSGVDPERVIFAPRKPLPEHLARHVHADLFLDTLPCNAHTTASDALWAGLPVLTCSGETFASRVAGSLLRAAEMKELIAVSPEEYETLALKLAREPKRLATLKRKLQRQRLKMPLFDIVRFTRSLESAYREMWKDHCLKHAAGSNRKH